MSIGHVAWGRVCVSSMRSRHVFFKTNYLMTNSAMDYICPMGPEVAWLRGRSFQSINATLPIKSGGLEKRSQMELSPAAWLGALEQALPEFSGEKAVCPPLAERLLAVGVGRVIRTEAGCLGNTYIWK